MLIRLSLAAAACATLAVAGMASSTAAPDSDSQGYVDSTARCTAPNTAVFFGSTETSRVAVCKTPRGAYQYRGVRVRDGAKLIVPAKPTDGGGFVAVNDGITYRITSSDLVVSVGDRVLREEPWADYHGQQAATAPVTTAPSASTPTPTPTSTTKLPPPLPAEVGGDG